MKINFRLEADRITFDDLIDLEEGKLKVVREVMAKSLVNDKDEFMDLDEARKIIGSLSIPEMTKTLNAFKDQIDQLKGNLLPPA